MRSMSLSTWMGSVMVTGHCGGSRHDIAFPDHSAPAVLRGGVSCSGEVLTWWLPFLIGDTRIGAWGCGAARAEVSVASAARGLISGE
jgi:hypothetical protein